MVTAALLKRAGVLIHLSIARAATLGLDGAGNVRKMSSGHKIAAQGTSLHLEPSGQPADSTVIFMHGLGDTAHGWVDSVDEFFAPQLRSTRFILLTAPTRPVTVNGGYPMPAWYDITSLGKDRIHDKSEGLEQSRARVAGVIDEQISKGIPAHKIVLAGFSQGGAMSLFTGVNYQHTLAGILCLSGYLVYPSGIALNDKSRQTPVLMLHGEDDGVVLPNYGRESAAKLKELGLNVELKMYPGLPHSASPEELQDALAFLKRVLR